jgi:hypothetical protein
MGFIPIHFIPPCFVPRIPCFLVHGALQALRVVAVEGQDLPVPAVVAWVTSFFPHTKFNKYRTSSYVYMSTVHGYSYSVCTIHYVQCSAVKLNPILYLYHQCQCYI